jgi:hypothetical protein
MKEEHPKKKSLDARFAKSPHTYARLHAVADMMERAIAEGCSADEAEERAIEQIRQLGQGLLKDWSEETHRQRLDQCLRENPSTIRHKKKD